MKGAVLLFYANYSKTMYDHPISNEHGTTYLTFCIPDEDNFYINEKYDIIIDITDIILLPIIGLNKLKLEDCNKVNYYT